MFNPIQSGRHEQEDSIAADGALLEASGLFDAETYRSVAGIEAAIDPVQHYLREGWRAGLDQGPNFEGSFLDPYYRSAGFFDPPAVTYTSLRAAGWPVYSTRAQAESVAAPIRASDLFDAASYQARLRLTAELDPALHYVLVGERLGHPPSDHFEPDYYGERNPDVSAAAICYLAHYVSSGRKEGRRPISVASQLNFPLRGLNPNQETILLVSHQVSRTGAPIIAYNIAMRLRRRYNVVGLLLSGGELVQDFADCCSAVVGPLSYADWHPVEFEHLIRRLLATYDISYALVNSIESRLVLKPLTCALVPTISLVHEFSSQVKPRGEMGRALEWSTHIVFPTKLAATSARAEYPNLDNRETQILPQGLCTLPPRVSRVDELQALGDKIRPAGADDDFVVLCCGTVTFRKGTDLFLACAAAINALAPARPIRFVWIGEGFGSEREKEYSATLSEQITRSRLNGKAIILDEVTDLEPAYALADLFFLSSRLDPMPNVAIEAAFHGLPVICFDEATGFAELLKRGEITCRGVVPYLDVNAAATLIAKLAGDDLALQDLGAATRCLAEMTFDMDRYVRELDKLARDAIGTMQQRSNDFETINADSMFDMNLFLDPSDAVSSREDAIRLFVSRSAALGMNRRPTVNFYYRRPCPGFHPQIYAHENSGRFDSTIINPLAYFIRSGKPDGPWCHQVITPDTERSVNEVNLRTGLHVHFYYPELATDLLRRLYRNHAPCDLLLTTDTRAKANVLYSATTGYARGNVVVRLVPNRGRDIAAFLTGFGDVLARYDVVGHLHGKRSLFAADPAVGETWREFLWQNLLGHLYPMMDIILNRLATNNSIGIVFPEDPHLSDWDFNRDCATGLAERIGIEVPLPPFFDFPIGTMFWTRTEALRPLFDLKLGWEDYPEEPVPIDGTILHAIERLLPFVARRAGYRYATSHISGVTW
jgi:glycosyltransferase involved in cell wall biosynthesis